MLKLRASVLKWHCLGPGVGPTSACASGSGHGEDEHLNSMGSSFGPIDPLEYIPAIFSCYLEHLVRRESVEHSLFKGTQTQTFGIPPFLPNRCTAAALLHLLALP